MRTDPLISVILVNYNVKEYLEQALLSLERSLWKIPHEIYVVDNASVDGSTAHIRSRFPEVKLIESTENLGFGRANNLALEKVSGEYLVLINPDTVVQEDTFEKLLIFFAEHPDAGAATCKIINPDGSFSVDCRHSIPTPTIALWKVLGLSKLFPGSRIFGRYNLTYLDPDDTYPVPAISGSFMMIKKSVLEEVGFFDEQFFMYCEDIDLCHRINRGGFKIYYVPTTQIIHYKGESTKKNNIDYVITFNKALYRFFQKYYAKSSIFFFRWFVVIGIILRGVFIYLRNFLHDHYPLILDTLILNGVLLLSFIMRFELLEGFYWYNFIHQYWVINVLCTIFFLATAFYLEVYPHYRFSIQGIIKANLITYTLLASITFFFKQFGFSRMVVLIAAIFSPALMILWRGILKRSHRGDRSTWGKDLLSKPTVIVGNGSGLVSLYQKIRDMKDIGYELLGVVTLNGDQRVFEQHHIPVLGRMENLAELIRIHRVRQVIFSSEMLSYERILKTMSGMGMPHLEYKIAPSNLEVMIGKSTIERLDDYPLLDIEYSIGKPFNRFNKRAFDIILSSALFLTGIPLCLPVFLWQRKTKRVIKIRSEKGEALSIVQIGDIHHKKMVDYWLMLREVLLGKLTLVGAPLEPFSRGESDSPNYYYKPGITGLVQINHHKTLTPDDREKYHLFYLKNQSLMLDIEILLKAAFSKTNHTGGWQKRSAR